MSSLLIERFGYSQKKNLEGAEEGKIPGFGEQLRNNLWPKSTIFWITGVYLALAIIRPWDILLPWLETLRFQRTYALVALVAVLLSKKTRFEMTSQSLTVALFLSTLGVGGLLAWDPSLAWDAFYGYITVVFIYFIVVMVIRTPYELIWLIIIYIVTMTVYLSKSLWEFFVHSYHVWDRGSGIARMVGIELLYGGPNGVAASIVHSLPMLVFLWSVRREASFGWPNYSRKIFRLLLLFYLVLAGISVILTNSRAGMVCSIIFIILLILRGKGFARRFSLSLAAVLLLTTTWFLMGVQHRDRFRTIWDSEAGPEGATVSAIGRIEGLKAGLKMFERFPFTGVGIGSFSSYRKAQVDGSSLGAHSLIGQVLGTTGVIGTMTFLLMVLTILGNCRRIGALTKNRDGPTTKALRNLSLACRDGVILLFFQGFFGHNLLRYNWLLVAAVSILALEFTKDCVQDES